LKHHRDALDFSAAWARAQLARGGTQRLSAQPRGIHPGPNGPKSNQGRRGLSKPSPPARGGAPGHWTHLDMYIFWAVGVPLSPCTPHLEPPLEPLHSPEPPRTPPNPPPPQKNKKKPKTHLEFWSRRSGKYGVLGLWSPLDKLEVPVDVSNPISYSERHHRPGMEERAFH
jgi:hypothetical protein